MTIDQYFLMFWRKYITGTYGKRYRSLKSGRYVCATGATRAYPIYSKVNSKVKYYTDFHKEEK